MASDGSLEDLLAEFRGLEEELRRAQAEAVPGDEPSIAVGSRLRRSLKRRQFRLTRPVSRRYDRIGAELAGLAAQVVERVAETQSEVTMLRRELERKAGAADGGTPEGPGPEVPADAYYWAFERRMRGAEELIDARLRGYEDLAVHLLDEFGRDPAPLWLDLGCGNGEFLSILREWGWRVHGVDVSARAIDACRARGLEATGGDALEYLASRRGEAPGGISAVQVIEHLAKDRGWSSSTPRGPRSDREGPSWSRRSTRSRARSRIRSSPTSPTPGRRIPRPSV